MALDRLAARHAPKAIARSRFSGLTIEAEVAAGGRIHRVLLLKPMTYMNLSGRAVAEAVRFFKIEPERDVLVVVDDVAIPCGQLRIRASGSAGGHNGLADIERSLGTDAYARCRVGVDAPGRVAQKDYVLGRFSDEQWPLVDKALTSAADAAEVWLAEGTEAAMNRFNTRGEGPSSPPPRPSPSPPPTPPAPGRDGDSAPTV
jgi:PTH1 family peptidyl-tRNA hydrolase